MANKKYKLTDGNMWATDGIHDFGQNKTQRTINSEVNTALGGKAPTNHASTSTTYGKGTSSNYGHVKISDSLTDTTPAATGGVVPSMKAVSDLNGAINDKVSKSGDTMTGALQSQTAYISNGSYSSNQWATEIYFKDANNVNIGQFRTGHMANGDELVEFFARRNVSGLDVFNALRLGIHPNGTKYVEFNDTADATIWRKALGLSYSANDTISITSSLVLNGFVNSNSTIAYFDFVTDKSMENISSISITAMSGYFLGVSGAFEGTSSSTISFTDSGYGRSLSKQGNNHVRIGITKSSGYNVTANTPVSYFGTLSLKFT